ncbi:outer arm dynein light chain 1 [Rhodocollybia butyracea]|uniref:Outer arm dynein light chain 1 n=1 Tax=Rhodocollybia butyracea TaxID=206335 RepID=A0A9P5U4V4_9AGAR|nr:outer arm dynein light chain 1 [Rhodocollybia butyracea]
MSAKRFPLLSSIMNSLPLVGDRISYLGQLGVVKFVGEVENTNGLWLGVEWDNPERGKHDGVKDGKRYFSCRIPNSGSFIRPSGQVLRGVSFLQALKAKYVEQFYGSESQEKITLGSSNGVIEVEAVNLDKIRGKFANLERLREVSLENELVGTVDKQGSIRETCPNIRGLDLSTSLLPTWTAIADIATELPALQRLVLNRNRFTETVLDASKMSISFLNLTDLQLNATLIGWNEMQRVTSFMPKLISVELGRNGLSVPDNPTIGKGSSIHIINLEGNRCKEWTRICNSLSSYEHLERVILTSNDINFIPPPEKASMILNNLKHISLNSNNLNTWNDIDSLALWCPSLSSLAVVENPLIESGDETRYTRPFIIARISGLLSLDSTAVSTRERIDSELLYLSYISQRFSLDQSGTALSRLAREHPRWEELSKKHGMTLSTTAVVSQQDRLSRKLFEVGVQKMMAATPAEAIEGTKPVPMRVLPSMTLKVFRLKVRKTLNIHKDLAFSLWLRMDDGSWAELQADSHNIDWLGLEGGSSLACCIQSKEE